jgi:hypothetical protein
MNDGSTASSHLIPLELSDELKSYYRIAKSISRSVGNCKRRLSKISCRWQPARYGKGANLKTRSYNKKVPETVVRPARSDTLSKTSIPTHQCEVLLDG